MKRAPEGPEIRSTDKKGKGKGREGGKAQGNSNSAGGLGKDPLEIAYGPIVNADTKITEDDFKVDGADGPLEASKKPEQGGNSSQHDDDASPIREESGQWERASETEEDSSPQYGVVGGAEEFQNVWGK